MKLQCKRPVNVNGISIGGPAPLICLPLVAENDTDLFRQAQALLPLAPDLLEWRIDAFDNSISRTCMNSLRCSWTIPAQRFRLEWKRP